MWWHSIRYTYSVHLYSNHIRTSFVSIYAVTQCLEPPADDTGGTQTFSYCPTGSVSVNVTCKAEETAYRIHPQVVIGSHHFSLSDNTDVDQWMITVFWNNDTVLYYSLPLTDATRGLNISCRSESVAQNITLKAGS